MAWNMQECPLFLICDICCYTLIFCTQGIEGVQYEGHTPFRSVHSSCGRMSYVISTRNARALAKPNGKVRIQHYIKAGQTFHTSSVTDLHRHQNILPPVVTTAMAAAKFVVSISSTHTHNWLLSSVLFCGINTNRLCVWKTWQFLLY